tara:strand:+ start:19329 stop:19535 length:207 start_codon:yes stop_codon:yes gene_type:complete
MKDGPIQATVAVVKALWRFIGGVVSSAELSDDERCPRDSDFFGVYNYRSGRHDDGTDPVGWYEQEWRD